MKFLVNTKRGYEDGIRALGSEHNHIYTYVNFKNLKKYALNKYPCLKNWYMIEIWNNPDNFFKEPDQVIYNPDYID